MTKEITKTRILQELEDKFGLREFEAEKFLFSETVIPTYNVEQHFEAWKAQFAEVSITSTGAVVVFTVPADEKWSLWRYDVVFMGAGAYTLAGIYTRRRVNTGSDFCYLDLGAAKSASYHIELSMPVVLMPEDLIIVNVDGYTSTQDLRVYIDYLVEKIR